VWNIRFAVPMPTHEITFGSILYFEDITIDACLCSITAAEQFTKF
jgi:hypothetical protein